MNVHLTLRHIRVTTVGVE